MCLDLGHRVARRPAHRLRVTFALLGLFACALPSPSGATCPAGGLGIQAPESIPQRIPVSGYQDRVQQLDRQMQRMWLDRVRILFLGDSITQGWLPLVFNQFYGHRGPLNLGVAGDSTNGLLYRLQRIPLGTSLKPQLVVLLIGTNNLWPGANPASVAEGIGAVVEQLRRRSPGSHILLVGLLPRGQTASDPLRIKAREVNAILARCADKMITYAEPGRMLIDAEGRMAPEIAYDFLHPSWLGYAILAAGLEPYVRNLMGD